jgi:membrane peptidoglycan carboxypeptidase
MRSRRKWKIAGGVVAFGLALLALEAWRLPSGEEMRAQLSSRYPVGSKRTWRPVSAISPRLKEAVVEWEDPEFYHHSGISFAGIWLAIQVNIRAGAFERGGSTITQQLVKNLFLTREKTLRRKFDDIVLARRLEKVMSKEEILEVYLNTAEWGDDLYGAERAARYYFGVSSADLDWGQSALLAGMLTNPHTLNPCSHPGAAQSRRNTVLRLLRREGHITAEEYDAAAAQSVAVVCRKGTEDP